ncbi:MAG: PfkB family carbohydrate kinase, partial [Anaerolineaceae bacterium]|nr:PfkB family carbohydrate kinase [Anaerolineaceae bacterium]
LSDAAMLHLSGYALLESPQREALQRAVALAQAGGIPISLDTALDPALRCPDDMRRLLPGLTICALGLEEAAALLGSDNPDEAIERLLALRVKIAAIKLAGKGCLLASEAEKVRIPPFIVPSVDATGAGDAFCAGLIYGWLNGLSLSATGVLAGALGALATTALGGGGSLHDINSLITFLADQRATPAYSAYLAAFDELIQTLQKTRPRT